MRERSGSWVHEEQILDVVKTDHHHPVARSMRDRSGREVLCLLMGMEREAL